MEKQQEGVKNNVFKRIGSWFAQTWKKFDQKHHTLAQFLVFFILSNGVTLLQMILMPVLKAVFGGTDLINVNFQVWQLGQNADATPYFIFDFKAGTLANGGGGGLAFFLAVQITLLIAQVINFFAQRNITFKSDGNPWKAAFWYAVAYVAITIFASAARGLYTAPIYNLLMNTWNMGATGETLADFITMIIYSAISFWVFFPIFKVIFPQRKEKKEAAQSPENK